MPPGKKLLDLVKSVNKTPRALAPKQYLSCQVLLVHINLCTYTDTQTHTHSNTLTESLIWQAETSFGGFRHSSSQQRPTGLLIRCMCSCLYVRIFTFHLLWNSTDGVYCTCTHGPECSLHSVATWEVALLHPPRHLIAEVQRDLRLRHSSKGTHVHTLLCEWVDREGIVVFLFVSSFLLQY